MPFPNGKSVVLVEQPGYAGMIGSLQLLGATAIGIRRTEEGFDLEELEKLFRTNSIKLFYTTPRFHNPLGTSLDRRQKERIAALAAKYDVYVAEDDYLADLENDSRADPIFSYDRSEHVIYIRSFSKIMLPGLRLGVAVLPKALLHTFRLYKSSSDLSTSALSQAALEIHLSSGLFRRHAGLMRSRYGSRQQALRAACDERLADGGFRLSRAAGGIFAQLALPASVPAEEFAAVLRQRQVAVLPTSRFYLSGAEQTNAVRLSVMRADEAAIAEAVRHIRAAADEMAARNANRPPGVVWI